MANRNSFLSDSLSHLSLLGGTLDSPALVSHPQSLQKQQQRWSDKAQQLVKGVYLERPRRVLELSGLRQKAVKLNKDMSRMDGPFERTLQNLTKVERALEAVRSREAAVVSAILGTDQAKECRSLFE